MGLEWREILPRSPLKAGSQNFFALDGALDGGRPLTHVRLRIYPDGGVAPAADLRRAARRRCLGWRARIDLAALVNGARAVACSDMFFGDLDQLILPGRPENMGGGWETRRRRGPGHDWAIVQLAARGFLEEIEVDTCHFKGNYPGPLLARRLRGAGRAARRAQLAHRRMGAGAGRTEARGRHHPPLRRPGRAGALGLRAAQHLSGRRGGPPALPRPGGAAVSPDGEAASSAEAAGLAALDALPAAALAEELATAAAPAALRPSVAARRPFGSRRSASLAAAAAVEAALTRRRLARGLLPPSAHRRHRGLAGPVRPRQPQSKTWSQGEQSRGGRPRTTSVLRAAWPPATWPTRSASATFSSSCATGKAPPRCWRSSKPGWQRHSRRAAGRRRRAAEDHPACACTSCCASRLRRSLRPCCLHSRSLLRKPP